MSLSIVFPQFLLPHSSVKLGRFITSIDIPHQSYHDPPYAELPKSTILPRDSYIGLSHNGSHVSFGSKLTSLMSVGLSKRVKTQVEVKAERITTHTLDNSDTWFEKAMGMLATRTWIERAVDRGNDIYMIVGFHTITNARIVHGSVRATNLVGELNVPIGLSLATVGAVIPFGNIIDPSIGAAIHELDGAQSCFLAPDEQICSFQYRRVRHRWLCSNSLDSSWLSKSPRWSSVERGRNEEDGLDDIIEVEAVPLDNPEGEWERQELPDGEILLLRAEENTPHTP